MRRYGHSRRARAIVVFVVAAVAGTGTAHAAGPYRKEYEPYISRAAYEALESFRLGSTVDPAENARLQIAYDKAYDEGRFNDTQEANYIRAIEREAVAALWKMLDDPAGNRYFLPRFTPVQERLDGMRRPLVGAGSEKVVYVQSDDDLSGLRIAIRRPPIAPGDGGLETAAILPFRWIKGRGVVSLDPPDNLRVLIRMKKEGDHAMLGMSFSITGKGGKTTEVRPEIYTSPKFGDDRFHASSGAAVSARGCMDCHYQGFNNGPSKFVGPPRNGSKAEFATALRRMPGVDGFLADARKNGATEEEARIAEALITRPDATLARWSDLKYAVLRLWNAIHDANQPYLDDADTRFVEYHDTYGSAWLDAGNLDKALEHFNLAIDRNSQIATLFMKRAIIFARTGRITEAGGDLDRAIRLNPRNAWAYVLRVSFDYQTADYRRGQEDAEQAVRLVPDRGYAHKALSTAEFGLGHYRRALEEAYLAIHLDPDDPQGHALRAWLLATAPDAALRDGAEAVREATKAYDLSAGKPTRWRQMLAAAHAEAGHFAEAVKWQEEVMNDPPLAKSFMAEQRKGAGDRLELYRKGQPYRDSVQTPPGQR